MPTGSHLPTGHMPTRASVLVICNFVKVHSSHMPSWTFLVGHV